MEKSSYPKTNTPEVSVDSNRVSRLVEDSRLKRFSILKISNRSCASMINMEPLVIIWFDRKVPDC